jgi:hypothetical protein
MAKIHQIPTILNFLAESQGHAAHAKTTQRQMRNDAISQ